jgi:HD domain
MSHRWQVPLATATGGRRLCPPGYQRVGHPWRGKARLSGLAVSFHDADSDDATEKWQSRRTIDHTRSLSDALSSRPCCSPCAATVQRRRTRSGNWIRRPMRTASSPGVAMCPRRDRVDPHGRKRVGVPAVQASRPAQHRSRLVGADLHTAAAGEDRPHRQRGVVHGPARRHPPRQRLRPRADSQREVRRFQQRFVHRHKHLRTCSCGSRRRGPHYYDGIPTRPGKGLPHVQAVADVVRDASSCPQVRLAGLLHDVVEDTARTVADVREQFGDTVADIVAHVTEDDTYAPRKRALRDQVRAARLARHGHRAGRQDRDPASRGRGSPTRPCASANAATTVRPPRSRATPGWTARCAVSSNSCSTQSKRALSHTCKEGPRPAHGSSRFGRTVRARAHGTECRWHAKAQRGLQRE